MDTLNTQLSATAEFYTRLGTSFLMGKGLYKAVL